MDPQRELLATVEGEMTRVLQNTSFFERVGENRFFDGSEDQLDFTRIGRLSQTDSLINQNPRGGIVGAH